MATSDEAPDRLRSIGASPFVGRDENLDQLERVAARVLSGQPWLAVIEGAPGVGKSTFVRRFLDGRQGWCVLRAVGDRSEVDYPYGIVRQLLARVDARVMERFPALPDLLDAGGATFAVGEQLLLLLGALQTAGPVVLVVDDWQWADTRSVQALGMVFRRLLADTVLSVLTVRSGLTALPADHLRSLETLQHRTIVTIPGLSVGEISELAVLLGRTDLSRHDLLAIHESTGGHTLYVQTLLADPGSEKTRSGGLAVPRSLTRQLQELVSALPPQARGLLEALAVLNRPVTAEQLAKFARVDDPAGHLTGPIAAGLIDPIADVPTAAVSFRHGIQREAVYQGIGPHRRRSLHAAAAEFVTGRDTWAHRVAAVDHAADGLAEELEVAAGNEAAEGRSELAATRLLWSGDISSAREDRERRTLLAAASYLLGRVPARAEPLRARIDAYRQTALKSAVLGWFDLSAGRFSSAERHLSEAQSKAATIQVKILAGVGLSTVYALEGQGKAAITAATAVLSLPGLDLQALHVARACLAWGKAFLEGPRAGLAEFAESGWLAEDAPDLAPADAFLLTSRGQFRLYAGSPLAAAEDATAALSLSRAKSIPAENELAYVTLAGAQYLLGRWDEATVSVEYATTIALSDGKTWSYAQCHALTCCLHAVRGEWAIAERALVEVQRCVEETGPPQYAVHVALAAGVLAQARGDQRGMLAACRPLIDSRELHQGWPRVFRSWWLPLYIEGLIGTGRYTAAETALKQLSSQVPGVPHLNLTSIWLEGLLRSQRGDLDGAAAVWQRGLADPKSSEDRPLHRAFVEQAYGASQVRSGRLSRGVPWLRKAHDRYVRLGARPFLQRCEVDLAAAGSPVGANQDEELEHLTARERDVAHRVGLGLTNPEIAADLLVTTKTVEYHLRNIFQRLGVSNRRQLRDRVRAARPEAYG
ncbi:AAA family ATPase [Amycolatopsis japonica]